jgi:hypothetical protein
MTAGGGVGCDGDRVAVWVAGDGAGAGGLVAAACGRFDVAGGEGPVDGVSWAAAAASRLTASASSAVPVAVAAGNPAGIVRVMLE